MRLGPFKIAKVLGNNTSVLQNLEGEELVGLVNGRFLKCFHVYLLRGCPNSLYIPVSFYFH